MALQSTYGAPRVLWGQGFVYVGSTGFTSGSVTMDATNEATMSIGYLAWSDGGSHTVDTSGSSSIGWRTGTVTFANAGTTFKVGIAPVDTGAGPVARATNSTDVITFDVSKSMTGGGGGVTNGAWQTHVPDTGTKTIAHGALVAVCMQMTARGGVDTVQATGGTGRASHRPVVTAFTGGSYAAPDLTPNVIITASDGTIGYLNGSLPFTTANTRTWNSGSGSAEYGQLYKMPLCKVSGIWGILDPDADCDVVLYSDPLGGSPVAEKTVSIDLNTVYSASPRYFEVLFSSPYTTTYDQVLGCVFKPGGSSVSTQYRTLNSSTHRAAEPGGLETYGISRASGAFANANSSLDHYFIGPILSAFDDGTGSGGGMLRHPGMTGSING